MELKLRKTGDIYVIDISGEMDLYNSGQLKALFGRMVSGGVKRFVINLQEVKYLDSTGIGVLLTIFSTSQKEGYRLAIANVEGTVKKVIELTKLMDYLPIEETLQKAITRVKGE